MVHMPSLEIWEWGLKIFCSALTLTTHVDHLLFTQHKQTNTEQQTLSTLSSTEKMAELIYSKRLISIKMVYIIIVLYICTMQELGNDYR